MIEQFRAEALQAEMSNEQPAEMSNEEPAAGEVAMGGHLRAAMSKQAEMSAEELQAAMMCAKEMWANLAGSG